MCLGIASLSLSFVSQAQTLKLRVVQSENQLPVEGARLHIYIDDADSESSTDKDGRIIVEYPREDIRYGIRVSTSVEGFLPVSVTWKKRDLMEISGEQTIEIQRGFSIGGKIETVDGKPIKGARVILSAMPSRDSGWKTALTNFETRTDNEGKWFCDKVPEKIESVRIRLEHPYYITNQYYDYGGGDRPIGLLKTFEDVIQLRESLKLEGTVLDENGRGLKGARVSAGETNDWTKGRKPTAITNQTGAFSFKDLEPGEMQIAVQAEGYSSEAQQVLIEQGMKPLRFMMEPAATIRGRVVDASGIPVLNAEVLLATQSKGAYIRDGRIERNNSAPSTKTDPDGVFRFPPAEDEFTLVVLSEMGIAQVTKAEFEASNKIQLQGWASLSGTLRVGNEAPKGEVVVLNLNREHRPNAPSVYFDYRGGTEEGGRFSFDRVVPGDIQVTRQVMLSESPGVGSGWSNALSESVHVNPGERKEIVLGGTGREVQARLIVPATAEKEITFDQVQGSLQTRLSMPDTHEEIIAMSTEEREAAAKEIQMWTQSSEAKEARRKRKQYGFKVLPDGAFTIQDVEPGEYVVDISVMSPPPAAPINGVVTHHFRPIARYRGVAIIPDATGEEANKPVDLGGVVLMVLENK